MNKRGQKNMLELIDIKKTYHGKYVDVQVLNGINLMISKGDFVMIIGKSGCGKSTLLNVIGCMDNFDAGGFFFNGIDVKGLKDKQLASFRNKNIGFVFQAFNLINEITVLENVEVPMGLAGVKSKERKERAVELLKMVDLEEKVYNKPLELSGGQQQRVAIARAMANTPNILLCDEPTGNLDEENGKIVMHLLEKLNANGTTIVMVTHDMTLAKYANKIIEINDGRIVSWD